MAGTMRTRWRRFDRYGVGTLTRRLFASSPVRPPPTSPRRTPTEDARSRSILAARAAAAKSGTDTMVLEVGPIIGITDVFVITSGRNVRQVRTIAEEIEKKLKDEGHAGPIRTEGLQDASWVLLDYGDFVAHVFLEETRGYLQPRPAVVRRPPPGVGGRGSRGILRVWGKGTNRPKRTNSGEIRRSILLLHCPWCSISGGWVRASPAFFGSCDPGHRSRLRGRAARRGSGR